MMESNLLKRYSNYLSLIYLNLQNNANNFHIYIYIYIYMCVCVCVCVRAHVCLENISKYNIFMRWTADYI